MKRFLKSVLIPVLSSRPLAAMATRLLGYGIPVFMLHRITGDAEQVTGGITQAHLRRCIEYLMENGYQCISLEHLVNTLRRGDTLPEKCAVFTMDDGYLDQAEIAAPVFIEYGCPLTFFVITGMLDGILWPWDAQVSWVFRNTGKPVITTEIAGHDLALELGNADSRQRAKQVVLDILRAQPADATADLVHRLATDADVGIPETAPEQFRPMSWDTARDLETRGIGFAPHSVTHSILSRLSADALQQELHQSWDRLAAELARPLKVFCYPTGRSTDFGDREMDALEQNGFLGAVTTTPSFVETGSRNSRDIFRLPRFPLPDTLEDFIQYCTWIEYVKHHP